MTREYRLISRDGKYKTPWRPWVDDIPGPEPVLFDWRPTGRDKAMLGNDYGMELRGQPDECAVRNSG